MKDKKNIRQRRGLMSRWLSEYLEDSGVQEDSAYSTKEQNTQKKWIDGRDVYERTFVIDNASFKNFSDKLGVVSNMQNAMDAAFYSMDATPSTEGGMLATEEGIIKAEGGMLIAEDGIARPISLSSEYIAVPLGNVTVIKKYLAVTTFKDELSSTLNMPVNGKFSGYRVGGTSDGVFNDFFVIDTDEKNYNQLFFYFGGQLDSVAQINLVVEYVKGSDDTPSKSLDGGSGYYGLTPCYPYFSLSDDCLLSVTPSVCKSGSETIGVSSLQALNGMEFTDIISYSPPSTAPISNMSKETMKMFYDGVDGNPSFRLKYADGTYSPDFFVTCWAV